MKVEQLYQELKDLADKLDVAVSEQNFRNAGVQVQSGHCKVKNKNHCIIDKHLRLSRKVDALAECLSLFPHESIFIRPAVRELLEQITGKASRISN
jgi:hypothetical protein